LQLGPQASGEARDDEVWFDPEALAAASRVELGTSADERSGPSANERSGPAADWLEPASAIEQLRAVMTTPGVSLAELPSWPSAAPPDPHDGPSPSPSPRLGPALAELIGELRAGDVISFSGRGRGVGRTSLLAQLGDALALRSDAHGPETPVVCVIEGPSVFWRARSLARWSGLETRRFVESESESEAGAGPGSAHLQAFCASDWSHLDRRQRFVDAARLRDPAQRRELLGAIAAWGAALAAARGQQVWPVLLIDPIDNLGQRVSELFAELERAAGELGLIVLVSCDEPEPMQARALDRHTCARVRVSGSSESMGIMEIEACHRRVGPTGSVRLRWDRASGRIGGP
jgi:hypothetical protein